MPSVINPSPKPENDSSMHILSVYVLHRSVHSSKTYNKWCIASYEKSRHHWNKEMPLVLHAMTIFENPFINGGSALPTSRQITITKVQRTSSNGPGHIGQDEIQGSRFFRPCLYDFYSFGMRSDERQKW